MAGQPENALSKKKKKKNPNSEFVKVNDCLEKHANIEGQMRSFGGKLDQVVNTLIGTPEPGSLERKNGVVQELKAIKTEIKNSKKGGWTAKEKAAVAVAIIMGASGIVAALVAALL